MFKSDYYYWYIVSKFSVIHRTVKPESNNLKLTIKLYKKKWAILFEYRVIELVQ